MNKCFLTTAVLLTAIAFSAYADDGTDAKDMKELKMTPQIRPTDAGYYVAIDGGANFAQATGSKKVYESQTGDGSNTTYGSGSDSLGAVGGLKVGYNFESYDLGGGFGLQPAVEAEAYYLNSYSKQTYPATTAPRFAANGYREQYNDAAFMLNGLVRLKTGTFFTPYLGAGVGGEYISNSEATLYDFKSGAQFHLSGDDDFVFAVQGIAGFDIEVAKHWDIFTEYKFIAGIDPSLSNSNSRINYTAKYEPGYIGQHLITAGLKYNF